MKAIKSQKYEEAAQYRDKERKLLEELEKTETLWEEESITQGDCLRRKCSRSGCHDDRHTNTEDCRKRRRQTH